MSYAKFVFVTFAVILTTVQTVKCDNASSKIVFQFPEFDYKENTKNELNFREYESACDQSSKCTNLTGLERTKCVRECISPSCYQDIYRFDELEEGEIDVRLNSFKGCFIQRSNRSRN